MPSFDKIEEDYFWGGGNITEQDGTGLATLFRSVHDDISDAESDISTSQGNISTLQSSVSTLQSDMSTAQSDISTAQGDITTLQGDVTTAQGDITTLQGDMTTAQGDISNIKQGVILTSQIGATLEAALAAASSGDKIVVNSAVTALTAISSALDVEIEARPNGSITLGDQDVTINNFKGGRTSCFVYGGTGRVLFSGPNDVYPEWFGAVRDGVTDDSQGIQRAIDAVSSNGGIVSLGSGSYKVDLTLDMSNIVGVSIIGKYTEILSNATGKAVFELQGSERCIFTDLKITGDGTNTPSIAFFMARTTRVDKCNEHVFNRIYLGGYFTDGGWFVCNSELNQFEQCYTYFQDVSPLVSADFGIRFDTENSISYVAVYDAFNTTTKSCVRNSMRDMSILCLAGCTNFIPVIIGGSSSVVSLKDSYIVSRGNEGGILLCNGNHNAIAINNVLQEGGTNNTFLKCDADTTCEITSLSVVGCRAATTSLVIDSVPGVTFRRVSVENCFIVGDIDIGDATGGTVYDSNFFSWCAPDSAAFSAYRVYSSKIQMRTGTYTVHNYEQAVNIIRVSPNVAFELRNHNLLVQNNSSHDNAFLKAHITKTETIDFASIAAGNRGFIDINVLGAAIGDLVVATPRYVAVTGDLEAGLIPLPVIRTTDQVRLYLSNFTAAPIDPVAREWRICVWKY